MRAREVALIEPLLMMSDGVPERESSHIQPESRGYSPSRKVDSFDSHNKMMKMHESP